MLFRSELAILRMAAKPIIPVLNFIKKESELLPWQTALARVNLHNSVLFDTQSTSLAHETRLLEQCIAAMPIARDSLVRLLKAREKQEVFKNTAAIHLLAELLVDVGTYQVAVDASNESEVMQAQLKFKNLVIDAENQCLQGILAVFGFEIGRASCRERV